MSSQELLALYRTAKKECPACRRIVLRYEKTLKLSSEDTVHLQGCLFPPQK